MTHRQQVDTGAFCGTWLTRIDWTRDFSRRTPPSPSLGFSSDNKSLGFGQNQTIASLFTANSPQDLAAVQLSEEILRSLFYQFLPGGEIHLSVGPSLGAVVSDINLHCTALQCAL